MLSDEDSDDELDIITIEEIIPTISKKLKWYVKQSKLTNNVKTKIAEENLDKVVGGQSDDSVLRTAILGESLAELSSVEQSFKYGDINFKEP